MPITTTLIETERLMNLNAHGLKSRAVSRIYHGKCPHNEGDVLKLAYEDPQTGKPKIYAEGLITSIAELPYEQRARESEMSNLLAQAEGFQNATAWAHHFRAIYGVKPVGMVYRFLLNIKSLDGRVVAAVRRSEATKPESGEAHSSPPNIEPPGEARTVGSLGDLDDLDAFDEELFGSAS